MKARVVKLIDRLRRPSFARDIAKVASGSMGSQIILILAAPILMRIYNPADYGVFAVCTSILFLSVAASLRFNQAIPLPKTNKEAASITQLALAVLLIMTILFGISFHIFGHQIANIVKNPVITEYFWMLTAIFLITGISEILLSISLRLVYFKAVAYAQVAQSGSQVLYQISAGFIDPNPRHLLFGIVVGNSIAIIVYCLFFYRSLARNFPSIQLFNRSLLWKSAVNYRKFPLLATPSQIINSASIQITPFLLATFYSTSVVGWLAMAQRVIGLPIAAIGYGVSQVFFQRSAKIGNENPSELLILYRKTAGSMLIISLIPLGLLAITAPFLFGMVFGEQWSQSGLYVTILIPMFMCQFVVSPLSQIMAVISAQQVQLTWDLSRFALIAGLISVSALLEMSATACILVYSLGMSASYVWLYFLTVKTIKTRIRERQAMPCV